MKRDTFPLESGDRFRGGGGRDDEIDVVADVSGCNQACLEAGRVENDRRQVTVEGEVDTMAGEVLVDERGDRGGGNRYPLDADMALLELRFQLRILRDVGGCAEEAWLPGERVETSSTHGTGCAFSSALLCQLLRGAKPKQAVEAAKAYVTGALKAAYPIGRGKGPMHHLFGIVS